jgi:hypothetical protein
MIARDIPRQVLRWPGFALQTHPATADRPATYQRRNKNMQSENEPRRIRAQVRVTDKMVALVNMDNDQERFVCEIGDFS